MTGTAPGDEAWPAGTDGAFRRAEARAVLGAGDELWASAARDLLAWRVKTRSGFEVPDGAVAVPGERLVVVARVLWLEIEEPIEVVSVVRRPDRVAFSYRTRPGHPVSGEEAFILRRDGDAVVFEVRSLTAPSDSPFWRALFPALLVAQRITRRRYLRALRPRRR